MLPRQFGDRVTTEVTGADGKDLIPEPDSQKLALALLSLLDRNGSRDDPEAPEPPAMVERERGEGTVIDKQSCPRCGRSAG